MGSGDFGFLWGGVRVGGFECLGPCGLYKRGGGLRVKGWGLSVEGRGWRVEERE